MYSGTMQKKRVTAENKGSLPGWGPRSGQGSTLPPPNPPPPQRGRDPRTVGQTAEGPDGGDDVAEEEEEGDGALAVVLGLVEEAHAAAVRRAQLPVADVAHVGQPHPDGADGSGCGQGAGVGERGKGNGTESGMGGAVPEPGRSLETPPRSPT